MPLDKNTKPYYDDFDETAKYLQILFRPSISVQAREMTQIQSILQNQIERFGNHVFKEGAKVLSGETSLDTAISYLKLADQYLSTDITVSNFEGKTIIGTTSGTVASVVSTEAKTITDPNTLFFNTMTGNSSISVAASIANGSSSITLSGIDATELFVVGMNVSGTGIPSDTYISEITSATIIVLSNAATVTNASANLTVSSSDSFTDGETIVTTDGLYYATVEGDSNGHEGTASRVIINSGIYYTQGYFALVDAQTLILEKYSNTPSYKVGLKFSDSFVDASDDISLNDPAAGSKNFNAPGAHRYKVDLVLSKYALDDTIPSSFIELMTIKDGIIQSTVETTQYSELAKELARRTYDESGDYTVREFSIHLRNHLNDGENFGVYSESDGGDASKFIVSLDPGKAYVRGYEIETRGQTLIEIDRARTTLLENNSIIPFSLGNYITVTNMTGIFDISSYESISLYDDIVSGYPAGELGTAKVRGIEFVSGTPGDSAAVYKIYLFDIVMNTDSNGNYYDFSGTKSIATSGVSKSADIVLVSSLAYITDASNNSAIVPLPTITSVKTLSSSDNSYTVKRYHSGVMTGTSLTLTANTNEIFSAYSSANYQVSIVTASGTATGNGYADGDIINMADSGNSVVLSGSPTGRQVIITIPDISGSTIEVVSTITKTNQVEKTKTLTSTSETVAHASVITLNKADIFKIVSITDATTSADITNQYVLDNGQRDSYYDRGTLTFNEQYTTPAGNVTIAYQYFAHGSGDFFSVDSYDGVIDYEDIPIFTSPTTGVKYELQNCLDFRPRINDGGTGFSVTSELIAPGETLITDFEYYLPRIDRIILDYSGKFSVVNGVPNKNPAIPSLPDNSLLLYTVYIPAYTYDIADISTVKTENKRYTMRDIGAIEKRLENIEYYTALSLLEKDTSSLFIDDGAGNNRFKNGFLVDNFSSHLVGNSELSDYECSIDTVTGTLRPSYSANSVSMEFNSGSSSNYQKTGTLITLPYSNEAMITQPYASDTININPYNVFNWVGSITLSPASDTWYDTKTTPSVTVANESDSANAMALSNNSNVMWGAWTYNWNEAGPAYLARDGVGTQKTSQSGTATRTGIIISSDGTASTTVSSNTETVPYMRSIVVSFTASALKPNVTVYPFFDNVLVSPYVTPTGGSLGGSLVTDSQGNVSGTFTIPNNSTLKFRTGTKQFTLCDVQSLSSLSSATTLCDTSFTSQGSIDSTSGAVSTKTSNVVTETVKVSRTVAYNVIDVYNSSNSHHSYTVGSTTYGDICYNDPVAQTFLIDSTGGAFISKIDLYFATKDSNNIPVKLQVRNVVNGYPGQYIIPLTEVVMYPDDISVSDDGQTATSFVFDSPVYLEDGKEYSFVLMANSDSYTVWTGKIGNTDVYTGSRISQQPYTGSLFKSQNASTWTADQEQDVKFTIHRCVFNTGVIGTVAFKNGSTSNVTLGDDPFYTTSSSNTILVYHPNHGLNTGDTTTYTNATESVNGIPYSEINDTHTITYVDIDYYNITATTNATGTGISGGSGIVATGNYRLDVGNIIAETLDFDGASTIWAMKAADLSGTLHSSFLSVEPNQDYAFDDERIIFSEENEPVTKSFILNGYMTTDNKYLSPVIDTERLALVVVSNRINNDTTDETHAHSGSALARYITKNVTLSTQASGIKVYFSAIRPPLSNISVYIKYQSDVNLTDSFDDLEYVELNRVSYPDGSKVEYKDYEFGLDDISPYLIFSVKIVMTSEDTSSVPKIQEFRGIALA